MNTGSLRYALAGIALSVVCAFSATPLAAQPGDQGCPIGGVPTISCPVFDDRIISEAVRTRLAGIVIPPGSTCVTITVVGGVVTLTGTVTDEARRDVAGLLALSVRGVRQVMNRLTISPQTIEDLRLVIAVKEAINRAPINPRHIRVFVTNGVVQLTGMVDDSVDAADAEAAAWGVPGVTAVQNNLTIRWIGVTS